MPLFQVLAALLLPFLIFSSAEIIVQQPNADVVHLDVSQLARSRHGDAACSLNIQSELPTSDDPQPLYIVPGTSQFWPTTASGRLVVPHGDSIELHCPGGFANASRTADDDDESAESGETVRPLAIPNRTRILLATCAEGGLFRWNERKAAVAFERFICRQEHKVRVELAGQCGLEGRSQLYRVGFNLTGHSDGDRFAETMSICHDDAAVRAVYAHHTLRPANAQFQRSVRRVNFSKADGQFGNLNMQFLYTQKNQRRRADALYAANAAQYFAGKMDFLARGHLAAKADMIYASQQLATFIFHNVAPQWQAFNGGNWVQLEDEVRQFVARAQITVDVYTGTWGTLALRTPAGEERELHLAGPEKSGGVAGRLPVPRLFYRILVDWQARPKPRGIALVGVNNPHAGMAELLAQYVICPDVQEEVAWLGWMRATRPGKGYLYACSVAELARSVGHLPKRLLQVNELLDGPAKSVGRMQMESDASGTAESCTSNAKECDGWRRRSAHRAGPEVAVG